MYSQLPYWGISLFFTSQFQFLYISQSVSHPRFCKHKTAKPFFQKHVSHNVFFEGLSLCTLRSMTKLLLTSVIQNQAPEAPRIGALLIPWC